jgi:hypothetical protein
MQVFQTLNDVKQKSVEYRSFITHQDLQLYLDHFIIWESGYNT